VSQRRKQWLGRRPVMVEPLERLAPPGKAHQSDHWLTGGGHDLAETLVKREQGSQAGTAIPRRISDRERTFRIGELRRGCDGVAQR